MKSETIVALDSLHQTSRPAGPIEKTLRDALAFFGPNGERWCKNASTVFMQGIEHRCSVGSISRAATNFPTACRTSALFCDATGVANIMAWNDQENRTWTEVAMAFDHAIAEAHARGI